MATRSGGSSSGSKSKSSGGSGSSGKRSTTKRSTSGSSGAGSAGRADKSVEAFRDALEHSVTLSRERLQDVVDDAVKRGRMTRDDANELVSSLLNRSRRYSDELVKQLERLLDQAQREVESRTAPARRRAVFLNKSDHTHRNRDGARSIARFATDNSHFEAVRRSAQPPIKPSHPRDFSLLGNNKGN